MPILNLNGTNRKHGIATGHTIKGSIFGPGLASRQHAVIGFHGKTYNSPFTSSSKSVFPTGQTVSTQPHVAATKVESPGDVVPVKDFVKVHPWEKGSHFSTTKPVRAIVERTGGPSPQADTPANPNAPAPLRQPRPKRPISQPPVVKSTNLSFLRSGGTLGGHVDPQAGVSSDVSRWLTVKKGVVA
jgi:hypothetical protein